MGRYLTPAHGSAHSPARLTYDPWGSWLAPGGHNDWNEWTHARVCVWQTLLLATSMFMIVSLAWLTAAMAVNPEWCHCVIGWGWTCLLTPSAAVCSQSAVMWWLEARGKHVGSVGACDWMCVRCLWKLILLLTAQCLCSTWEKFAMWWWAESWPLELARCLLFHHGVFDASY